MKKISLFLFASLFLLAACTDEKAEVEELIKATFTGYQEAILANRGIEAVTYIDQATIDYYAHLFELVKSGSREEVEALDLVDQVSVLMARLRMKPEEIKRMTVNQFIAYSIDSGMIGKGGAARFTFSKMTEYEGDKAKAMIVSQGRQGQNASTEFLFSKENGEWKLNLTNLLEMSKKSFAQVAQNQGQTKEQFVRAILSAAAGTDTIPARIWEVGE
jgi:hypothetical protein